MSAPLPASESVAAWRTQPEVSRFRSDRICGDCGYNLREQPVRRDPGTAQWLALCPECGRFAHAGPGPGAWSLRVARWLSVLTGIGMVLGYLAGVFFCGIGLFLAMVECGEANVAYDWRNGNSHYSLHIGTVEHGLCVSLMLVAAWSATFALAIIHALWLPQWRRSSTVIWGVVWQSLAGGAAIALICSGALHRHEDVAGYWKAHLVLAGSLFAAALLGGLLGALFARPVGRWLVRHFLPPSLGQAFRWLWLADGLALPPSLA